MRTIKFRCWDKENKIMFTQGEPDLETLQSFIYHRGDKELMQFTGLYDKNGKEIYEGDIVKWMDSDGNERIDEVKFIDGGFRLCNISYTIFHYPEKEIIGNIHDNPELL